MAEATDAPDELLWTSFLRRAPDVPWIPPELVGTRGVMSLIEVLAMGGAIRRVPDAATAFAHRAARWLINIPGQWADPADTPAEIAWVRETFAALEPHLSGGTYANFMQTGEAEAYGVALDRLRAVKREYDPENVFRLNQNIVP